VVHSLRQRWLRKIKRGRPFLKIKSSRSQIIILSIFLLTGIFFPVLIFNISSIVLDRPEYRKIDGFTITAYCPGKCCNAKWAYLTSTGKTMGYYISLGYNIAATDPRIIPLGTRFIYDNREYTSIDVGGAIKGKRIDLLFYTHKETVEFGIRRDQSILVIGEE